MLQQIQITVTGQVQGVGFRYSVLDEAQKLGLTGWVKNYDVNSVIITAVGPKESLLTLLAWCQTGPALAKVTQVTHNWKGKIGGFKDFKIVV